MRLTNHTRGGTEWSELNPDFEAYKVARIKVRKLKKFYVHLIVYIIVNILLLALDFHKLEPNERFFSFHNFSTVFYWGIGLAAHAATVFIPNLVFGSHWEDRKMKQFMEKEKNNNWE